MTDIDESGVSMGDERTRCAHTMIWAAGVAASPLARSLGVPLDRVGRVPVERELHLARTPGAYVIGDLAALNDADGQPLPGCRARGAAAGETRRPEHRASD